MPDEPQGLFETIAQSPRLPSLPAVALEVIDLVQRPDVNVEQLATTIGNDPALSSKILKTVNSSFYAQARSITTITQAIVVLGLNSVRTLALGFTLVDSVGEESGLDHDDFWRRSIRAAVGARELASRVAPTAREEVFLAGLLSRFGILAMSGVLGERYGETLEACEDDFERLENLEREQLGFTHLDLGARLATDWNLPPTVIAAISHRRSPDDADENLRDLVRLVAAGDDLAGVFGSSPGVALEQYRRETEEWFGLDESESDRRLTEADAAAESLFALFEIGATDLPSVSEIMARANEALSTISISTAQEANRLEQENRALAAQASTDALTGLANRRHFDEFLAEQVAIAHRYRGPIACLFLDLDHFKRVNDTYGHQAGDEVLRMIGSILRQEMRDADLPGRYGGEEFAVVMPATNGAEGALVAERVRTAIECTLITVPELDEPLRVTASIGVAELNIGSLEPAEALIARADAAVYEAKSTGRNRVVADVMQPAA